MINPGSYFLRLHQSLVWKTGKFSIFVTGPFVLWQMRQFAHGMAQPAL